MNTRIKNGELLFRIMRYYIAPISIVFSFFYLYYITMIVMALVILFSLVGLYGNKPDKEDIRNYIGSIIFIVFSIIVCFLVPRTYVVLALNTIIVIIIILITEKIRKEMGWKNPFTKNQ